MASTLPTPNDCCNTCDCADQLVTISGGGGGDIHIEAANPSNPLPLGIDFWINSATNQAWYRSPVDGSPILWVA